MVLFLNENRVLGQDTKMMRLSEQSLEQMVPTNGATFCFENNILSLSPNIMVKLHLVKMSSCDATVIRTTHFQ